MTTPAERSARTTARRIALALAVVGVVLVGGEALARVTHFGDVQVLDAGETGHFDETRRYDPLLFWSLRPEYRDDATGIHINAHGLRGPELSDTPSREYRILSLGESSTFAGYLPYEETYSARVEAQLGQVDGREVRVLNAGVPGYTLFQGYQYLLHRGLALEPDAVLLYFGYNDFLPVGFLAGRAGEMRAGLTDRELFESRARAGPLERLVRWSHLLRGLNARLRGGASPTGAEGRASERDAGPRVPEADRRWLYERILELCRERGIRVVVVVPIYLSFTDHEALLRELASEHEDLLLVDVPALGPELSPGRAKGTLFDDRVHPNAAGQALIARAIVAAWRQRFGRR